MPVEVIDCTPEQLPQANESSVAIGGHMEGCRIGVDAGGSDRKVSAVIDGKTVYSEEVVWHPKTEPDTRYHFNGVVNTTAQGNPVPLGYGRMIVGSAVVSAGIYAMDRK